MKKSIISQFMLFTFSIMIFAWGICIVCGQFGITLKSQKFIYLPYVLGGWSPTIASYIVLKKNGQVTGFKDWLKNIFQMKQSALQYLLVIFLCFLYFVPQILISGLEKLNPFYLIIVLTPLMIFGGGLEEAGWRYILQPELDKRIGFVFSSVTVAVIWSLWHLPLFFIPGTSQFGTQYFLFALNVFALTFALGAIRKISGSVFLCVLFHCMVNACSGIFILKQSFLGLAVMLILLVSISIIAVMRDTSKRKNADITQNEQTEKLESM